MKTLLIITIVLLTVPAAVMADGLMLATAENYPSGLMRLRMTRVDVNITGIVAETSVYQEFVNEWNQSTDAVYSFPLPPGARATQFLYWYDGKIYKAVLKVQEQATNPGTGEGGVAAEVNAYIGRNGIRIALKDIGAGKIQKVQLDYIQLCEYFQGASTFLYPLSTADFITYPLDHLEFNIHVQSGSVISSFDIPSHTGMQIGYAGTHELKVSLKHSKAFLNNDFIFTYQTDQTKLGIDFYSVANDSSDGHFALFIRPENQAPADSILPRRILFLLSNSSSMFGYKLSQSIAAISDIFDFLNDGDQFNILVYNYSVQSWQTSPVSATVENIAAARNYLDGITASSGSNLGQGLNSCLNQVTDDNYCNAVLVFTDGIAYIDPVSIGTSNTNKTGIFPIAIGDNFNFARLEMLAAYSYGFVTYIGAEDNMKLKISRLITQVTQPVLKDVTLEYGMAGLSQILPEKLPSVYAGTYFLTTGRYANSTVSALSIGGTSAKGPAAYDFLLDFTSATDTLHFTEILWAKEMIEYLEWMIEIYGETPERKEQLIELSLRYNIRCRYTAYVADYLNEYTAIDRIATITPRATSSRLVGNFPNPFNPSTTIQFYISPASAHIGPKLLRIYNALGQLVFIIDLSEYGPGFYEIRFNGTDFTGKSLPSGTYFVLLQVGQDISTLRITLLR
jgi:Ca-activated chloride channel family protein